ncbi:MAG: hypothetical protein H0T65_24775, partial [Deltaproteobacteria bacterium]|nr:hypothetical protein [Deltaproteobacteria bacterium]
MGLDARSEELLRAIARNPDDNEPRLAFAKHIEAEAPAHAALIVAQCSGNDDPALVHAFRDELPQPLRDQEDELDEEELRPVRGFLDRERWTLEQRDFVEIDPDVLFRVAPSCTTISILDVTDFDAVGARIRRFDTLVLTGTHIHSASARRLAAARGFAHLRQLQLDTTWIDDASLFEVYQALPVLERLHVLERRDSEQSRLEVIRRAACAPSLRELDISGRRDLPPLDLRGFSALRNLTAAQCVLDAGFALLPNRFHAVHLTFCELTGGLRAELHESRVFSKLRDLALRGNDAQVETLVVLLASPHCGPLRSLDVSDFDTYREGSRVPDKNSLYLVQALANAASSLEQLTLCISLDDAAQQELARIPFARLAWLDVFEALTPTAAHAFASAPWIRGLRELSFDISLLDERSARALAGALGPNCQV